MEEEVYNLQKEDYDMAKRRKNRKKWIFWLILLVLLVAAGVVAFLVWNNYFRNKADVNRTEDKMEIVEKKEDNKDTSNTEMSNGDNKEYRDEAEKAVEEKKVVPYEGEDPNVNKELTGVVTYAGVNGDALMIRVNIDQYLDSGVCELSLQGSGMYSDTANIVGSASTATCEGFNVPMGELGPGAYQIVIRVSSGDKSGTIRGTVDI